MRGVTQLGYLGFAVSDLAAWERFATGVLGLAVADRDAESGALALRMDTHRQRFFVEPAVAGGVTDDLAFVGWQVADGAALDETAARLRAAGVAVSDGSDEEAAARGVERLARFVDPAGVPSEIYCGPAVESQPFVPGTVRSGFVADEQGLGHLVLGAQDLAASRRFYVELLGFRDSDRITCELHGYHVDILFFHVNTRHHTLALGERLPKRLHHFMLEARGMDDVGLGFDRTLAAGLRIMQTLGRHPNDRMFSFYAKTPSGFQFELGWGGRPVDDATWQTTTYDHISEWGHQPPVVLAPPKERR